MKYFNFLWVVVALIFVTAGYGSLTEASQEEIESYQLLSDHPIWNKIEKIFSRGNVLETKQRFFKAGFQILHEQPSGMYVAKHPSLSGYLVKLYLDSHPQAGQLQWMIDRCKGAENIRNLIAKKKLKHFTVPKKWIYYPEASSPILVVEDMQIVSEEKSKIAWKTAGKSELKELYTLLKNGFGSCYLKQNIPYTKSGKFACVDTAYPYRQFHYWQAKKYFSIEMQQYWDELVAGNP